MPPLAYVRSLNPRLPRPVWVLEAGSFANTFGDGLVMPFLVIYLHSVRGFSIGTAGLVVAAMYGIAPVSGLTGGTLVDRFGARPTAAASLALLAAGTAGFPLVRAPWHAFALALVAGWGKGSFWPGQSSLVAALTPRERRHAAYALQRVTWSLGFGVGSVVGGLIAATGHPATFTVLFLLDAWTFVAFIAALAVLPRIPREPRDTESRAGRYRDVLSDRAFVGAILLNGIFVTAGYALLNSMLPVFGKTEAGVGEAGIGIVFGLNTLTILAAQLPIARALEGRRRMPAFALIGTLWAGAWLLTLAGGTWFTGASATAILGSVGIVFALGECLHGAVQGPLVADLADSRLRGRSMALWLITSQVGLALGSAVGGFVLARTAAGLWLGAATICLVTGLGALALERRIPGDARRTPARPRETAIPAAQS